MWEETVVDYTSSVACELGVIGIEIKAATAGTTTRRFSLSLLGVG